MTKEEIEKENKRLTELLNHSNVRLAEEQLQNVELEEENEQLKIKIKALESANKAMVKEIDDMSSGGIGILSKITKLEEEKCELLGLIQAKDKLIEKMKRCYNCKFNDKFIDVPCDDCEENYSKWELAE